MADIFTKTAQLAKRIRSAQFVRENGLENQSQIDTGSSIS